MVHQLLSPRLVSMPKGVSLAPWHRRKAAEKSCCKLQSRQDKITRSWQCQEAPHSTISFTLFSTMRRSTKRTVLGHSCSDISHRNKTSGEFTSWQLKQMPSYVLCIHHLLSSVEKANAINSNHSQGLIFAGNASKQHNHHAHSQSF